MISVLRGDAPVIVSVPHAGTEIPDDIAADLVSPELARKDADLYVDLLYSFAVGMDATLVRTSISRTVIDVNRDPSGASLYPGQATTGLCPLTTFDEEPLYLEGGEPCEAEIGRRRSMYFDRYHAALTEEIARLRAMHPRVVLYEAHSIRSVVPMLFEGALPAFNIGTNGGKSCDPALARAIERICAATGHPTVVDGRFKGGWTTRHYGKPEEGVHAIQMELAMRTYLDENAGVWPPPWDTARAAACQEVLRHVLAAAQLFAEGNA